MKLRGKCSAERLKSRWKQQVRRNDSQKKGTTREEGEDKEELWGNRERQRSLVARGSVYTGRIQGRRKTGLTAYLLLLCIFLVYKITLKISNIHATV
jgi:hypothetical protein